MKQIQRKGNRIRASDRSLVVRSITLRLTVLFLGILLLLNIPALLHTDWNRVSLLHEGSIKLTVTPYMVVSVMAAALVCGVASFLYDRYCPDKIKQLCHRQKLSRMILENGWYGVRAVTGQRLFQRPASQQVKRENHPFPQSVLPLG